VGGLGGPPGPPFKSGRGLSATLTHCVEAAKYDKKLVVVVVVVVVVSLLRMYQTHNHI